jgi:hypothetical protein
MDASCDRRAGEGIEQVVSTGALRRDGFDDRRRQAGRNQQAATQRETGSVARTLQLFWFSERALAVEKPKSEFRMHFVDAPGTSSPSGWTKAAIQPAVQPSSPASQGDRGVIAHASDPSPVARSMRLFARSAGRPMPVAAKPPSTAIVCPVM